MRHHLERFSSGALLHVQPWWFYLPRTPGAAAALDAAAAAPASGRALVPRAAPPIPAGLVRSSDLCSSRHRRTSCRGYVLPLLPALAALVGWRSTISATRAVAGRVRRAAGRFPDRRAVAAGGSGERMVGGAHRSAFHWTWLTPVFSLRGGLDLEVAGQRLAAVLTVTAACDGRDDLPEGSVEPEMERIATARDSPGRRRARAGRLRRAVTSATGSTGSSITLVPSRRAARLTRAASASYSTPAGLPVVRHGARTGAATPGPVDPR